MENYQKTPKTTNDHPETTQKLPFVAKSYQMLPFVAKSYQMLPKIPVPGQYVSWDNMSPSCTGTICLLGQYVPFLNSKIMSNRGTFCPGDVLSRDNICPGTICPGTKCPQSGYWATWPHHLRVAHFFSHAISQLTGRLDSLTKESPEIKF